MSNFVITIGRQHGSGGRYIGEELARVLNIPCYDSELIAETAQQSGFAEGFVQTHEEQRPTSFLYSLVTGSATISGDKPVSVQLFQAQSEVIRSLAAKGSFIIIGRCANYVLRSENVRTVDLFVHAPMFARVARISERDELDAAEAEKIIKQTDKARQAYYNFFTGERWGDVQSYDLAVNTAAIGIPGVVELVTQYLKLRGMI